ncbi:MAG: NAD(P)-dependent alcohol dehydrogenase [Deinococcota bacterium]
MQGLITHQKSIMLDTSLKMPSVGRNEVLVKVMAASVTSTDVEVSQGTFNLMSKLSGSRPSVKTGLEFSGVIVEGNAHFQPEDKVFGYVHLFKEPKTHQEYIAVSQDYMAHMPATLSFEEAASLPLGALTSLVALQELANVGTNDHVLINGAAGGVGIYAIQIAKLLGARVTAVAGPNQEAFLSQLGADHVINYKETAIQNLPSQFDVIFELTTKVAFKDIQHLLSARGQFIPANPFKALVDIAANTIRAKKTKYLMVTQGSQHKLQSITGWIEEGKLSAYHDSVFALSDYQEAFVRSQISGKQGSVVLKIIDSAT